MCIRDSIAADTLSRINIKNLTFEREKETVAKIYHIIKNRSDLANIIGELIQQQKKDSKLNKIYQILTEQDDRIT